MCVKILYPALCLMSDNTGSPKQTEEEDSTFGEGAASDTTSLACSILNYKYENGRRYHAFHEGEYPLPNDEQEQDRLDLLHHLHLLILDGYLYLAPIKNDIRRLSKVSCRCIQSLEPF